MKNIGMTIICVTPMNDCICLMRAAIITPNAVMANASSSISPKTPRTSGDAVGHVDDRASAIRITPCSARDGRAAEALADHDRAAAHRRDHHLAQEAELAVPDDRGGAEDRGEHHRRCTGRRGR